MKKNFMSPAEITQIGLLTALLTVAGAIKLPSLLPGLEFQISAPLAVGICFVFGFKRYLIIGILSSMISLALGTHNLFNVAIAMQFRIVGQRNGHALLSVYVRRIVEVRADVEVLPDQLVTNLGIDADRESLLQVLIRIGAIRQLLVSMPGKCVY